MAVASRMDLWRRVSNCVVIFWSGAIWNPRVLNDLDVGQMEMVWLVLLSGHERVMERSVRSERYGVPFSWNSHRRTYTDVLVSLRAPPDVVSTLDHCWRLVEIDDISVDGDKEWSRWWSDMVVVVSSTNPILLIVMVDREVGHQYWAPEEFDEWISKRSEYEFLFTVHP